MRTINCVHWHCNHLVESFKTFSKMFVQLFKLSPAPVEQLKRRLESSLILVVN